MEVSTAIRRGKTGLQTYGVSVVRLGVDVIAYLSLSPVCHVLQWQLRPVDGGGLEPYWQAQADDDDPKGEDGIAPQPDALFGFCRGRCILSRRVL